MLLADQSVSGGCSWEKLLIQEEKDIFVGKKEFEDFSFITCREMLILNCRLKTLVSLSTHCRSLRQRAVQIVIPGQGHRSSPLNVFSCLVHAFQEKFLKLISPGVKVGLFGLKIPGKLPLVLKLKFAQPDVLK